jgi:GntR family transcriptional regulator
MFHIDPDDPTPVHTQIVRSVRASIGAGVLEPGDALPTVRQVAVELRVNANAVERAYRELERMGVVEHRAGTGFFLADVRPPHDEALLGQLAALEDDFLRRASEIGFSLDEIIIHLDSRRSA